MIEVLSRTHNIISISQDAIPDHFKGYTLIVYLKERDMIVLSGWEDSTDLIAELIKEYLELTVPDHERVLTEVFYTGLSDIDLEIWHVIEELYQLRNGKKA